MARASATASLGMKVSLGNKKGFTQYDSASPHHSITVERGDYPDEMPDDELIEEASKLHSLARKLVEKKINDDLKELKKEE